MKLKDYLTEEKDIANSIKKDIDALNLSIDKPISVRSKGQYKPKFKGGEVVYDILAGQSMDFEQKKKSDFTRTQQEYDSVIAILKKYGLQLKKGKLNIGSGKDSQETWSSADNAVAVVLSFTRAIIGKRYWFSIRIQKMSDVVTYQKKQLAGLKNYD